MRGRAAVTGALVAAWLLMGVGMIDVGLAQDVPAAPPPTFQEYPLPSGEGPHDVWPAADGGVWYTAQRSGELGWLDPTSGQTRLVALGPGSAPHGVIVGPDGAPWVTDGGQNAIVRVDPTTLAVLFDAFAFPTVGAQVRQIAGRAGEVWAAESGQDRLVVARSR